MFKYQAESQSRQAIANLGIERGSSLLKTKYKFVRARWRPDRRLKKDANEVLFEAVASRRSRKDGVSWEWIDDEGKMIAREVVQDGIQSLAVTSEMTWQMRDALVASWYLRIWWIRGEETYEKPSFRAQGMFYFE